LLKETIESAAQQHYAMWELIVICEPSQALAVRDLPEFLGIEGKQVLQVVEAEERSPEHLLNGVAASSGEFIWFVKCGDLLARHALSSVVHVLNGRMDTDLFYCDEDQSLPDGTDPIPFFKPSWSPELLLSMNYLSYSSVFRRTLLSEIIKANEREHELSLYDCLLWAAERTHQIVHLSSVLYHSRGGSDSQAVDVARPTECLSAEKSALERALRRRGLEGTVEEPVSGTFRVRYRLDQRPLVSILIPTRDRIRLLSQCIASIEERTTYAPYEIIILDNGSVSKEARAYFSGIAKKWRVLSCPGPFNFSDINNYGASEAKGEYLLFLNDDTEVITQDWLTVMMEQAFRPGIGAVGAKLLYPNGRIQHGGVVLGVGGVAGHAFRHTLNHEWGYHGLAHLTRNCSAVTAACMLVSRAFFRQIHGFDSTLPVEYNDVDLCLRIAREGHRIVYAPDAVLYHYESATRKGTRCRTDEERVQQIWGELIRKGDPYYNVNLTRDREDWSLRV
jgi:GT2 family glycosyltransferase